MRVPPMPPAHASAASHAGSFSPKAIPAASQERREEDVARCFIHFRKENKAKRGVIVIRFLFQILCYLDLALVLLNLLNWAVRRV